MYRLLLLLLTISIAVNHAFAQNQVKIDDVVKTIVPGATIRILPPFHNEPGITGIEVVAAPWPFNGTIAPDGKNLLIFSTIDVRTYNTYIVDFNTGMIRLVRIKGMEDVIKIGGVWPLSFIRRATWDSKDPHYFYGVAHEVQGGKQLLSRIWRIRVNDFEGEPTTPADEDNFLVDVTPDGEGMLIARTEGEKTKWFLRSLADNKDTEFDYPQEAEVDKFSPDGKMMSGLRDTGTAGSLEIMTLPDKRSGIIFNALQTSLLYPDSPPYIVGNTMWNYDSASLLINLSFADRTASDNEIWRITLRGEAQRLYKGAEIIANSANGRYWLIRIDQTYILADIENTH